MTNYERIDASTRFDGPVRDGHELRYRFAAGFVESGDRVVDAGCGTGYGKRILCREDNGYLGVDRNPPDVTVHRADFETGEGLEVFAVWLFDVFVGLEIIEHLSDEGVERFLAIARQARRWIVLSTPIVPNANPFHKQQFTAGELIEAVGLRPYGQLVQDGRYGLFAFRP